MTSSNSLTSDQKVTVPLGDRSYDILIGEQLISRAGELIKDHIQKPRVAIITDERVGQIHLTSLQSSLEKAGLEAVVFAVPAGEQTKSFKHYEELIDLLLTHQFGRDETLIALGGGVIGDLTGFVAATYKRGIRFIQIPTTLLSQVDSSVGGKTGINTRHGKNLVGAFNQPALVLADVSSLETLPKRDLLAGYAEVVKYALLGDFDFFEWLEANGEALVEGDTNARIEAVRRSVQAKADIVTKDEHEKGVRALLNLGHTFGHALEAEAGYRGELVHGEAVAVGMLMAMELSERLGLLDRQDIGRVENHYKKTGLLSQLPEISGVQWKAESLYAHMYQDKKVDQGKLTFILMKAIGDAFITQDVEKSDILLSLQKFTQS